MDDLEKVLQAKGKARAKALRWVSVCLVHSGRLAWLLLSGQTAQVMSPERVKERTLFRVPSLKTSRSIFKGKDHSGYKMI